MSIRRFAAVAVTLAVCLASSSSSAGSRDECLDAHGRAQELRERGQLARARQTFLTCAQSTCPALVQQDCARNSEDLAQLVPSVAFGARDSNSVDLPATGVYVDDMLLTNRLDDGRSYELDPGKHTVRYVHDGKEATLKIVLNQGERGRLLVATFVERAPRDAMVDTATTPPSPSSTRSAVPLVIAGVGIAAAVTGAVLFGVGSASVPNTCTVATRECAAAPNDPSLAKAESGVRLANAGLGIGIAGAATFVGGLVWYFLQSETVRESRRGRLAGPLFTF